jgi:hypothetical protein
VSLFSDFNHSASPFARVTFYTSVLRRATVLVTIPARSPNTATNVCTFNFLKAFLSMPSRPHATSSHLIHVHKSSISPLVASLSTLYHHLSQHYYSIKVGCTRLAQRFREAYHIAGLLPAQCMSISSNPFDKGSLNGHLVEFNPCGSPYFPAYFLCIPSTST